MLMEALQVILKLNEEELEVLQWHINALLSRDNDDQTSHKTETQSLGDIL